MIPLRSALKQSRGLAAAFAATTALLAPGSLAAQDGETTITAVMHSGLRVLDPVITTAHITRNHGYMVYDVLTAVDENLEPQPLAGAGTLITLSPQVQERIAFYRDLSMAFEGALTN